MVPRLAPHRAAPVLTLILVLVTGCGEGPAASPDEVRGEQARRMAIPILTYHPIMAPPPGTPFPDLWVLPENFSAQMAALKENGYRAITLRQAYEGWNRGAALPRRPIVVSFDDGYPSQHRKALPVLRRLGWPGVLNLKVNAFQGEGSLKPRDVGDLIAAGWEVDSHTVSHRDLTSLGPAELSHEIYSSRDGLRRQFGVPVDFFCYPAGRYNPAVLAAVRRAGYLGATTTVDGLATAQRPFELPRVRVSGGDDARELMTKLAALEGR